VDDIRTGTWVTVVEGRPSRMEIRRCRLVVMGGPDVGHTSELESDWIRVGARQGCDLVLTDPRVSGYHFEIRVTEDGYLLRDLDSTNGTYVGGHRVREIFLKPGTIIYVGDTRLRFEPRADSVSVDLSPSDRFGEMVGRSVGMRALFARLERVAPSDANVLITG
jgi:pSer/pThr/pTyr-binding forkhead associated (FHA) protein